VSLWCTIKDNKFYNMHDFLTKAINQLEKNKTVTIILLVLLTFFTGGIFIVIVTFIVLTTAPFIGIYYLNYLIKTLNYYKSEEFLSLKKQLSEKIIEYNEFDEFMAETKNYILEQQSLLTQGNVRHSTLTVYKNSKLDIYKYIVKYFFKDNKIGEESVQTVERILQKYDTLEKTYEILIEEYEELMQDIRETMYSGAYVFKSLTMKKLGSRKPPKFVKDYYLWYSFEYNSPTNRKHYSNKIVLDDNRLQDFAEYLSSLIKYRKSAKYQRQLMTSSLREYILNRDGYTCKTCGVSKESQSHLLLEIDHIMPISKGGITTESNLQALCWKCNRAKSNKIFEPS